MADKEQIEKALAAMAAQLSELKAKNESLEAKMSKANGGKGDGRVVEPIETTFKSANTDEKAFVVRAGNMENKDGPVPGVVGFSISKLVISKKGKVITGNNVFARGEDIKTLKEAIDSVYEQAVQKGVF